MEESYRVAEWEDREEVEFSELEGQKILDVKLYRVKNGSSEGNDVLVFTCENAVFEMYHEQSCCESVHLEDDGGVLGLSGEVKKAYETSDEDAAEDRDWHETWTFYHIRTMDDSICIRWYGESNGYYSESVEFYRVKKEGGKDDQESED